MIVLIVFIVVLETGQFHIVSAFYVSKTKFACLHILNNSAALLTFLVLNLNGMKTLMGFIRQHAGFCRTQKLKLPSLVINRPVRFMCIQNTSSSDVHGWPTWEAWAPQRNTSFLFDLCEDMVFSPKPTLTIRGQWGAGTPVQVTGMIKWGQKSKPQKILGPKFNPPKIPFRFSKP